MIVAERVLDECMNKCMNVEMKGDADRDDADGDDADGEQWPCRIFADLGFRLWGICKPRV